ncbi:MAG: adenylate/guanylate cyclase domain-containing protein [Gammaproteobacteria bacterium]
MAIAAAADTQPSVRNVADYTPKHLADRILQSKSALEGERKQVTVMFADIQGSMRLATQLDPEQWHAVLERYFAILTDAVHRFEGTVNQYTGDGIMAIFGAPIAHEDHARRACHAALQARDRLGEFADGLRVEQEINLGFRIGLNSGEVVVGKIGDDLRMDYTAQGATVGIAQRIEQLAASGHVYVSGHTEQLVAGFFRLRALGTTHLDGVAEAVPLFDLEGPGGARTRLDVAISRGLSRFVGRGLEMQILETALARTRSGHGQVVGIVGEPGLGKSRLCLEFVAHCRSLGLPVFEAHCPAHGRNIPYLPILELFRNYFGITADDSPSGAGRKIAETLASLDPALAPSLPVLFEFMGIVDPEHPPPPLDAAVKQRQLHDLVHRVVRAQDARGLVTVTLIDDLHWVDAGSDEFVKQLVNAVAGRRSLVVLNFRPEYTAAFASRPHYQQLPLVPLEEAPLRELVANLIGQDASVRALMDRVVAWTSGNPFYTEELVNSLVETGDLAGSAGHYRLVTALEQLAVPKSVRAVLAARIDRLPETAKRLLQTAAVIGKEFSGPLLQTIADLAPGEFADAIERLKSRDFLHERTLYPTSEYVFKHPLTHEVAYNSLLSTRRRTVHVAVARAYENEREDRLDEHAALIAHHYEEGGDIETAARWHRRAAEWVVGRDPSAVARHWRRLRDLLASLPASEERDRERAASSAALLQMAIRVGAREGDPEQYFDEARTLAERAGDRHLVALVGAYGMYRCVADGQAELYWSHGVESARLADLTDSADLQFVTRIFHQYGAMFSGRLTESVEVANLMISRAQDAPRLGHSLMQQDPLSTFEVGLAMASFALGDLPAAERAAAEALRLSLESGWNEGLVCSGGYASNCAGARGDHARQLQLAREAFDVAEQLGSQFFRVWIHVTLAKALLESGNASSALETLRLAEQIYVQAGVGGLWLGALYGQLSSTEFALGMTNESRVHALTGVEYCRPRLLRFDLSPWLALARADIALGLRDDA